MIGATYSAVDYNEYNETNDKNIFEDIIDKMILEQVSGINESFIRLISSLPKKDKRMAILSLLDKDRNLFTKIKDSILNENFSKLGHIKDVVLMLREYVKIAEVEKKKFGEVMTPLDLVKEMLNTLPKEVWSNPNLKWLDPANGTGPFPIIIIYKLMKGLESWEPNEELRYKHIIENMIYVCELQPKNMFLYLCAVDPKDEYVCNIYTGSFLDSNFDYHMDNVWNIDKFDIIIGNPPYNQMIDMVFLTKSYHISNKVLFVHPSTWLLDEKNKQKKFTNTKNLISEHLESIELFNGNGVFGISLFVPCVITYINKEKGSKLIRCNDRINKVELLYNNIFEINKYSNNGIYLTLKEKLINFSEKDNLLKHIGIDNGDFYVNVPQIRGDVKNRNKLGMGMDLPMVAESFTTLISSKFEVESSPKQQPFTFSVKSDADNFLSYLKTDFVRFSMSIYKNNQNQHRGELEIIPWLDFSREWTDSDLIKKFSLNDDEVEFIKKNIPVYY